MKLAKLVLACTLTLGIANAEDVMQKSMSIMEKGMTKIQKGFLNNNIELIKEGSLLVKEGNSLFNDKKIISNYLPENKKHLVNVAANASKRITADATIIELNLDDKAYTKAADGYSDMLNACSRCHGIVRSW